MHADWCSRIELSHLEQVAICILRGLGSAWAIRSRRQQGQRACVEGLPLLVYPVDQQESA